MPSLVSDFIINPVLRQARRLSTGFTTDNPGPTSEPAVGRRDAIPRRSVENAISESEEDGAEVAQPGVLRASGLASMPSLAPRPQPASSDWARHEDGMRDAPAELTSGDEVASDSGASVAQVWPAKQRSVLPEDDGMGILRQRIITIQARDISAEQKAQLMHQVLIEGYTKSQLASHAKRTLRPESPSSPTLSEERSGLLQNLWNSLSDNSGPLEIPLTPQDLMPTYVPVAPQSDALDRLENMEDEHDGARFLGCEHYRRNVKLQCVVCERWYTCRLCHDEAETHVLPRYATKNMLCMLCGCAQRASDSCIRCGEAAAHYYCGICKLWNDNPNKPIYHCNDCGICRIGQGVGKDFFHCNKCTACIPVSLVDSHKCIERSIDCDCPICGEYMFSSRRKVIFMSCGHSIHRTCWDEYMKTSYKCPICNKSCVNMETQFRNLDILIANQPMPPEYTDTRAVISCNDCSAKSQTAYHWLGLKCTICQSYNTIRLHLLDLPSEEAVGAGVAAQAAQAETDGTDAHTAGLHAFSAPEALAARDMPWPRGPTAHRPGASIGSREDTASFSPFLVPERLARSVSPLPVAAFPAQVDGAAVAGPPTEESDAEEDMLDFWGRARSLSPSSWRMHVHEDSGDSGDDEIDDDDDDIEDIDEDEEEEDPIALYGHR